MTGTGATSEVRPELSRLVTVIITLSVVFASVATPAGAESLRTVVQPGAAAVRTGTIIGGYSPFVVLLAPGPGPDCMTNVDCLPWVAAGCPSGLVGIDPALHTSIIDVRKIAGSKKRWTLNISTEAPAAMLGGVSVQLWSRSCAEIYQIGGNFRTAIETRASLNIPKTARWMTVASVDTPPLTWTLR